MRNYKKDFIMRGLIFGGFGPIIVGIVYAILNGTVVGFSLSGTQVCLAIISTYLLAFICAGASVFNQIEHWPTAKSLFCHFITLYVTYTLCYLINTWIPFSFSVIALYTGIFISTYAVIWVCVYAIIKSTSRRLNASISEN